MFKMPLQDLENHTFETANFNSQTLTDLATLGGSWTYTAKYTVVEDDGNANTVADIPLEIAMYDKGNNLSATFSGNTCCS